MGSNGSGAITVVHRPSKGGRLVILWGEFDLLCHATLGATLEKALVRDEEILVDLSDVTFLDASCVRKLALLLSLHQERLMLAAPSPEVKVSVAACGMEDLVRFGGSRLEQETRATA